MSKITQTAIKEIAKEIALGHTCYIQRYNAKLTFINPSLEDTSMILAQEKSLKEIHRKKEDYIKIEQPNTDDQLVIMKDFLKELPDKSVQKQLSNALNRNNPVRNFDQVIESDVTLHIQWDRFNYEQYQKWISQCIIDAYNY